MDFDTAKRIIDAELKNDIFSHYIIDLFGGEPFLQFELIKQIVDYVKSNYQHLQVQFSISTNGTLVHGEVKRWLQENKGLVFAGLSFDGTEEMQNINRSNSFDMIDLGFFAKYFSTQKIKMTISPLTLSDLADGVIFLHTQGFQVACNLAFDIDWTDPQYQRILEGQLEKLVCYYLSNPQVEPCSMLSLSIQMLDGSIPENPKKWCGSGSHMIAYDTDGTSYPCHFFLPITIGEEKSKNMRGVTFSEYVPIDCHDKKCKECCVSKICPTCMGANYDETGTLYTKSDSYCALMKTIIAANSYLYSMRLEKGYLNVSDNEKNRIRRGVLVVQSMME